LVIRRNRGDYALNKEMLKGTIDILILSVLSQGDNYGYEISRIIKTKTEGLFEIIEATMYLSLKRLETQKAIEAYWGDESGGSRRKYFKLSEQGKIQLSQLISDWKQTSQIVEKFI
jgi:PadR family transcriptional regulator, regulatory protein PadR